MNFLQGKSILLLGLGLILISNAVTLAGAAYNRSGEPESSLALSERELRPAGDWGLNRENSGMTVALRWRTLPQDKAGARSYDAIYENYGSEPRWLDQNKLVALGFDTTPRPASLEYRPYSILAKPVLLVLELNGPAYEEALVRARERAAKAEALHVVNPTVKDLEAKAKTARDQQEREEHRSSRLFIVDAGLDADALRAQYPDRGRYAIVRGQVQPHWNKRADNTFELAGSVTGTRFEKINVPFAFHRPLAAVVRHGEEGDSLELAPGAITVSFGHRLEPWIVAVATQ